MQSPQELSLPLLSSPAEQQQQPKDESSSSSNSTRSFQALDLFLSFALPVLLQIQFSMVMVVENLADASSTPHPVEPTTIHSAVATFFLASLMYRSMLDTNNNTESCLLVHLVPEMIGLATIAWTWYDNHVFGGFLCLSLGTIAMSAMVAFQCAVFLSESSKVSLLGLALTIGLPFLIYAQYYISFANMADDTTTGVTLFLVQCAVACFAVVTLMFRKVLEDANVEAIAVHLIPELVALATIVATARGDLDLGFTYLIGSDIVMALAIAGVCIRALARRGSHSAPVEATPEQKEPLMSAVQIV